MSSSSSGSHSSSPLNWKLCQVFGERIPGEGVSDVDVVSAIQFDKSGDHLAIGDRGGRVVIFERKEGEDDSTRIYSRKDLERHDHSKAERPEYQYKTEFQSHEPEFDFLKSVEIEEKINKIRWCCSTRKSLSLLTTNDKTIKFWKVKDTKTKKPKELEIDSQLYSERNLLSDKGFTISNGRAIEWKNDSAKDVKNYFAADGFRAKCRKVYAHAHDFNINSISTNSDGETFISADDLRLNLWNLEISNQCFNIVDIKPPNMEDLTEVVTTAEFHPSHCNLLAYCSSRGFIHIVDLRKSALCDRGATTLRDVDSHRAKSFFTEIIVSISDLKFSPDDRFLLTRDYMNLKLWDLRRQSSPVDVFKVHEYLRPRLTDLYHTDSIFDKFECCVSAGSHQFLTGSYSNHLRVFSHGDAREEGIEIEAGKSASRRIPVQPVSRFRRASLTNLTRGLYHRKSHENTHLDGNENVNLDDKILHVAWHPSIDLIAASSANSIYLYYA